MAAVFVLSATKYFATRGGKPLVHSDRVRDRLLRCERLAHHDEECRPRLAHAQRLSDVPTTLWIQGRVRQPRLLREHGDDSTIRLRDRPPRRDLSELDLPIDVSFMVGLLVGLVVH